MRDDDFALWMENNHRTGNGPLLAPRPRQDAKSRCRRVERFYGDLDEHFISDGLEEILQALSYSRDDEASKLPPKHRVTFENDKVDKVKGTASLRHAVHLYRLFCHSQPPARR